MVTINRNTPVIDGIDREIRYLRTHGIKVGIFGKNAKKTQKRSKKISKVSKNGKINSHKATRSKASVTVGEYAIYLNFGTSKMEKKPFFYDSVQNRESVKIITNKQKELLRNVCLGHLTGEEALLQLGIFVTNRIKGKILNNDYPNKPSTIARKQVNKYNTLRENDFLLNAVSFEIVTL